MLVYAPTVTCTVHLSRDRVLHSLLKRFKRNESFFFQIRRSAGRVLLRKRKPGLGPFTRRAHNKAWAHGDNTLGTHTTKTCTRQRNSIATEKKLKGQIFFIFFYSAKFFKISTISKEKVKKANILILKGNCFKQKSNKTNQNLTSSFN